LSVFSNLPKAPIADIKPHTDTRHGITRTDDYAWLRADNWQDVFQDPSVLDTNIRAYLEAENAFQEAALKDTEALQKSLFSEMKGRIKEDDTSIPVKDGPFAYGVEFVTGGEQPHYFRIPRDADKDSADKEILLNGDDEAQGKDYLRLGGISASPDHSLGLWGYDDKGSEFFSLRVRDLKTKKDLSDTLENTGGSGAWDASGTGFFYTALNENHRPSKIYYHKLGTDQSDDLLIHEEEDAGYFMGVGQSALNDVIYISIHDHETSEIWLIPADSPQTKPKLVAKRETGVEYDLTEGGDEFFILTNDGNAKDFKIMRAPFATPEKEHWTEVVAHNPGNLIISHGAYKNHLVWMEREEGLPKINIMDRTSGDVHSIEFDEEAFSLGFSGAAEYNTDVVRFSYSSMTTPSQLYDYNLLTRARDLLKTQEVPSGHDIHDYVTRRIMAPSHDGTLVPVSVLYHKDTKLDGSAPALLYGYGSYGMSIPASFNTNCLSLVDRGFVYAIAHIRGGKDKGFAWYDDGKRENKKNTFEDFVAAARYLVAENFTRHDRIVAQGGSAGGMLMGACVNMAPDAFGGVIAAVPFVDVLNTMLDDTLPLTPPEWPEWGNPIESQEAYEYIASYSPYDNVKAKSYPPILALAGLTDPRVTYWEPAKWVAKLRAKQQGDAPILLKTNMGAGHGGAAGRFQRLEEIAVEYAFALKTANIEK
jgi:oligopeptidase B